MKIEQLILVFISCCLVVGICVPIISFHISIPDFLSAESTELVLSKKMSINQMIGSIENFKAINFKDFKQVAFTGVYVSILLMPLLVVIIAITESYQYLFLIGLLFTLSCFIAFYYVFFGSFPDDKDMIQAELGWIYLIGSGIALMVVGDNYRDNTIYF